MKQLGKICIAFAIVGSLTVGLSSCKSGPKDSDLQTQAQTSLPEGISIDVKKGVATLTGEFKDDVAKQQAENAIKAIAGIKSVVDNATVKSVEISADDTLKASVTEALKSFAGVTADIKDGVVTLNGNIKKEDLPKIMQVVNALNPKKVENKLVY